MRLSSRYLFSRVYYAAFHRLLLVGACVRVRERRGDKEGDRGMHHACEPLYWWS